MKAIMLSLVNEYSLFLVGLVVIALVLLLTWKWFGLKWRLTGMVTVVVALAAFQFITSTNVNTVSSREELNRALTMGKPVLLELYSDY